MFVVINKNWGLYKASFNIQFERVFNLFKDKAFGEVIEDEIFGGKLRAQIGNTNLVPFNMSEHLHLATEESETGVIDVLKFINKL